MCCGVLLDDHVLFTSDTQFDPELLEEFDSKHSLSAIFHDCQLFTGGVHTGIEELATLPAELKQKLSWYTMVIGGATIENLLAKLVFTPGVKPFIPIDLTKLNQPIEAEVNLGRSASPSRAHH